MSRGCVLTTVDANCDYARTSYLITMMETARRRFHLLSIPKPPPPCHTEVFHTMIEKTAVKVIFGMMSFAREGAEQTRVYKPEDCQKILDILESRGHHELDTARMYGGGSSE